MLESGLECILFYIGTRSPNSAVNQVVSISLSSLNNCLYFIFVNCSNYFDHIDKLFQSPYS